MPQSDITLRQIDGRTLQALVLGDPTCGKVVVYHHGFPASRYESLLARAHISELGICLISIDRPGIGGSEHYPSRSLSDWSDDVRFVADSLGISKFAVLGVSGGTPGAVAVATNLSERVLSLTVVSGVAPIQLPGALHGTHFVNRFFLNLGRRRPKMARNCIATVAHIWMKYPIIPGLWLGAVLPKCDREVVANPIVAGVMAKSLKEAFLQGTGGVVTEFELLASDWCSMLAQVRAPTTIWHGMADTYVPVVMGRILHEQINGSVLHLVPDAGHFMIIPHLRQILEELVSTTWSSRDVGAA